MTYPLSKLTRALLGLHRYESNLPVAWRPSVDIYQGDDLWLIKVELAGVKVEDIRLQVKGRQLVLQGIRRDQKVSRNSIFHAMEIAYNRFERVFDFASSLEQASIHTEYLDGMLHIYLHMGGNR
ncbi:Hsp20/alpha crystallin family protein [Sedimenticola sp.]|uniref:Hsp20/alpha crystallin family protein n=1 Tax=Sedimenticola sp. TaxID=1940285 RepID=UPI003D12B000